MDTERKQQLEQFIQVLGLKEFHNLLILDQALTHSSYANENKASHGYYNERLEFLGDAILDLVVGEYLFLHYPNMPEGELSKARASVVSETPLASVCANGGLYPPGQGGTGYGRTHAAEHHGRRL